MNNEKTIPAAMLVGVSKSYQLGEINNIVIDRLSLTVPANAFTVIAGRSGSGKSTLLNLIAGLEKPDSGSIIINGASQNDSAETARTSFRGRHIGFVFQNFNLIPTLTAYENIEYPLLINGVAGKERRRRVKHLLQSVNLAGKENSFPNQLSGGQRQRIAIARALIHRPALILADEPTANLDGKTGMEIIQLLRQLQQERKAAILCSSHDPAIIEQADHQIWLQDGNTVTAPAPNASQI